MLLPSVVVDSGIQSISQLEHKNVCQPFRKLIRFFMSLCVFNRSAPAFRIALGEILQVTDKITHVYKMKLFVFEVN